MGKLMWHYTHRGVDHGPIAHDELCARFARAELPLHINVWQDDPTRRVPAATVAAFARAGAGAGAGANAGARAKAAAKPAVTPTPPPAPPPLPVAPSARGRPYFGEIHTRLVRQVDEKGVLQVRPWVRFLARQVDNVLLACAFLLLLGFLWPVDVRVFAMLALPVPLLIQAAALSWFRATAGKALLGIRVETAEGDRPSFLKALRREARAFGAGLACFHPRGWARVSDAYTELTQCGEAPWDDICELVVRHRAVGFARPVLAAAVAAASLTLSICTFNAARRWRETGPGPGTIELTQAGGEGGGWARRTNEAGVGPAGAPATRPAGGSKQRPKPKVLTLNGSFGGRPAKEGDRPAPGVVFKPAPRR